ncbi:MAG: Sorbitol-6-phosphate 2-dehydrogenase (EC [uncultured Campylobacterales bacterium]|uniref:Sorbitol-6-phosphate 2-dehydrogenase (EC) n=1 Tax=uncultured Campylobacterales bacterium TaxID=352960 RepID=A0A6S6SGT5_9BACT|nr:MAG: Sorbitol-6-phosphate 2-dehydrogenase (EC [uncultured Campylobacterales bacterium]
MILIIGAKSDIAKKCAHEYAKNGYNLTLASRDILELQDFASDIKIRHNINVILKEFDITKFETHQEFFESLEKKPFGTIVVSGYMNEQSICESNFKESLKTINTNFTGAVSILNIVAKHLETKKEGFIAAVSSVAGDRGRASNYIYGSSKAGLSAYLSGLRNRLYKSNIQVLTVKPGFVNTKMTAHLDLPKKLTASPKKVASDIYKAVEKNKNILYTKWIWKYIMFIIKSIPESIFKRLNL